ncbi:MAG: hypothetical protein ABIH89_08235 [Elusimicrobiota bacterium]
MQGKLIVNPDFIIDKKGNKKAVILDYEKYEELLEEIEDLRDVNDRKNESSRLFSEYHKKRMRKT